jgi:hypothetical protein
VRAHGRDLDNGQHILVGAYTELLRLMRQVGVPADAVLRLPLELRYADGFTLRALWLPAPLGLLGGLLAVRRVPFAERWGAIRFLSALRRSGFRVEPDCTVEVLLARHRQGGGIGHYLWRPLCVAALNTPPQLASAQVFATVLRDSLAGDSGATTCCCPLRRPLGAVSGTRAACARWRLRTGRMVQQVPDLAIDRHLRASCWPSARTSCSHLRRSRRNTLSITADLHLLPAIRDLGQTALAHARPRRGLVRCLTMTPCSAERLHRLRDQRAGRSPAMARQIAAACHANWRRPWRAARSALAR